MKYALGNMLNGAGGLNPDGLALDLQFAADKTLTARRGPTPVLTRASSGTFVGSNGLIQSAGNNVARFDHDPVTLASRGLLIEESRTNLLNGSQTFATSGGSQNNWVDTNIIRDGTLRTSPDGTANALRITASAANGTIISSAAAGSSAARVFSIFLRRVTGTGDIQYTLNNGSTWTTQSITGSWVRYTFAATTENQQVGIRIVTSGDAIEIWGAQLEAGSFATSYIPTTTASVVRSADVCSITAAAFSEMWNASEGTMYIEADPSRMSASLGGNRVIADFSNGTYSSQVMSIAKATGLARIETYINNAVATSANNLNPFKAAIAVRTGSNSSSLGGVITANTTSSTLTADRLQFRDPTGAAAGHPTCTIAAFRYYRKRLPNAKLQALTA